MTKHPHIRSQINRKKGMRGYKRMLRKRWVTKSYEYIASRMADLMLRPSPLWRCIAGKIEGGKETHYFAHD